MHMNILRYRKFRMKWIYQLLIKRKYDIISFSERECICIHATQTLIIDAEKIWARRGASPSTITLLQKEMKEIMWGGVRSFSNFLQIEAADRMDISSVACGLAWNKKTKVSRTGSLAQNVKKITKSGVSDSLYFARNLCISQFH